MFHDLTPQTIAMLGLTSVIVLGIFCQWLAWRIRVPSILLLLLTGMLVGPVSSMFTGSDGEVGRALLRPNELFGSDLLMAFVSLSVAIILFEGGLSLRVSEIKKVGAVVGWLLSIGVVITWILASLAGVYILELETRLAVLLGALLVLTGPTVVTPLLLHIRPVGKVTPILKWEGIVIDPIGALLAVLVFEAIISGQSLSDAPLHAALAVGKTIVLGGGLGVISALVLAWLLKHFWIPDILQSTVSIAFVAAFFTVSNLIQHESGLLTVTVMGAVLANQKKVDVEAIIEFKENLLPLLIAMLFILLSARLSADQLTDIGWREVLFVIALVVIVRPIAVWASTLRSKLTKAERVFISWMAPRGIVAAAVASIFAIRLSELREELNFDAAQVNMITTATFATIIGTVALYGLTAPPLARRLKLAEKSAQGILFVGADAWVRKLAEALQERGIRVLLVDTNRSHTAAARMSGLPTYTGNILSEHTVEELNLGGLGRMFAVTPNDWVNVLAVQRFGRLFGKVEVYQLTPMQNTDGSGGVDEHLFGRRLFGENISGHVLEHRITNGDIFRATKLSEEFNYDAFRAQHGSDAIPLFVIDSAGALNVVTAAGGLEPQPGDTIFALTTATSPEAKKEAAQAKKAEKDEANQN